MVDDMKRWWSAYGIALAVFLVLDGVWIPLVAQPIYRSGIGPLLASQFNLVAAVVFYLGFVAGLVHFGVQPGRDVALPVRVRDGALYGACTYGTWALTAAAVLREVPFFITITDIAWGVVASAVCTAVTTVVLRRLRGGSADNQK
ncbi:MAG: DUF2177 family protein [Propionibacterium sp.]|jgi:uncharacterized membrane protein|uniref:DUF2177 family protein n=1 Tax=Brooklawnia propionicigenes TaxID=3041175 RepID=A0AAN0KGN0_9ACTN|nr:DUF2177 family protein [Brooklawnia sp. SH051]NLI85222.1 DUF2177 family protein [Propionibacterium sp.]BEH02768.1 hypothetical protein brsh051_20490 [Brooklawnia sp. SH051]